MKLSYTQKGFAVPLSAYLFSAHLFAAPSLTIYNDNFAVVRDQIELNLQKGNNSIEYQDVTQQLEPDSVVLTPLSGKTTFKVLEQNYLSEPVSQSSLLQQYEGKTIEFEIDHSDRKEIVNGKIIRSGHKSPARQKPMIEVDGKVRFGIPGIPLFPAVDSDTLLKPTLNWLIESASNNKNKVELAYLTGGLSWKADYNVIARHKTENVDVNGWVTFNNQSGKTFEQAKIKLLAGDIHKIQPQMQRFFDTNTRAASLEQSAVQQRDFDEYHMYSIARSVDLRHGESKQIEFINASGINSRLLYIFGETHSNHRSQNTSPHLRTDPNFGLEKQTNVAIYREFENSKENKLGIALPKGRVRFYQEDDDSQLEFLGENTIEHTPSDETVSLYTGNAFDLKGSRTQLDFKVDSRNQWVIESIELTLTNQKSKAVTILINENLYRWSNWEIIDPSQAYKKINSQQIRFTVDVPAKGKKVVRYQVKYSW